MDFELRVVRNRVGRHNQNTLRRSATLLLSIAIVALACTPEEVDDSTVVLNGTSFNECGGYCINEVKIQGNTVEFIRSSWFPKDYPDKTINGTITDEGWNSIVNSIDTDTLATLPETIGCPDCWDQGAEWIEVIRPDFEKKITFEYGDTFQTIRSLVEQARTIRKRFEAQLSAYDSS